MSVDAALATSDVGAPEQSGMLPRDVLGETEAQPAPDTSLGPTALEQYAADQAAKAGANQAAALAGTTVTTGGIPVVTGTGLGAKIAQAAEHYLGVPYVWGGTGPGGLDCSGLVYTAYRAAGINLPRVSYEQANSGSRVALRALRPGDLVAWDNSTRNPGADHIAIYLGGGKIIEAAHPGTNVRIRMLGAKEGAYGVRMGWT
jgi:cell wall-associated NlpC family hydrolase